jgi:hypothetical protein
MRQAEAGNEEGTSPLDRARVITEQTRHLITRGEPAQAEQALQQAHQQAHQLFTTAGAEDEAATVMGIIADIAYDRGELDEALRIRREIELPAFERLGDTRETAVTWARSPTSPTSAASSTRQLSCSTSGWKSTNSSATLTG